MTVLPEDVARLHASAREGLELVGFEEVGLPLFRLTLDALIQERKEIPAIEEFALRALAAGIDTPSELGGLLGLEGSVVERTLADLWHRDNIDYRSTDGEAARLRLTDAGRLALEELEIVQPERREIMLGFDRLTWDVTGLEESELLRPLELRDLGLRELPSKLAKRPAPHELSPDRVSEVIKSLGLRRLESIDLLAIHAVIRAERTYRRAVMLVYATKDGRDIETAIAIDGRVSPDHEHALGELGGAARIGVTVQSDQKEPEVEEIEARMGMPTDESTKVARSLASLEQEIARIATGPREDQQIDEAELVKGPSYEELLAERDRLLQQLEGLSMRRVEVFDHPGLLEEALAGAEERFLLISPWITAAVVDDDFLSRLDSVCERGFPVHIAYGLTDARNDRPPKPWNKEAERAMRGLMKSHSNLTVKKLGNTHAKVLIWDRTLVVTSFNWLSFRGNPDRTFRQEEGYLIRVPNKVDETYRQHVFEIESADEMAD